MPRIKCRSCNHGWITIEERKTCSNCNGRGEINIWGRLIECTNCNHMGYTVIKRKIKCIDCQGRGTIDI